MVDIAIVGAGPTGLACALEAKAKGLSCILIEKGSITNSIRRFPVNMTFFSTPELLELHGIPFTTTSVRPTRSEALQYYRLVAQRMNIPLQLYTAVEKVEMLENDCFRLRTSKGDIEARFVIIATGYFDHTNMLNVPGEDLAHVRKYYTEADEFAGCDVVVIGGKNSAVETALDLWRHGARVTIVHRKEQLGASVKYWIKPDMENRLKNGEITAHFHSVVREIRYGELIIENLGSGEELTIKADFVIPHIGYRPDAEFLRRCGILLDEKTLIPHYDTTTYETNIPGMYVAGSVMCGCETWNIFIENGRAHALPIIQSILAKHSYEL